MRTKALSTTLKPLPVWTYLAMSIPYGAIIIGLYIFSNAWLATFIFHIGVGFVLYYFRPYVKSSFMKKSTQSPGIRDRIFILIWIMTCTFSGIIVFFSWDFISFGREVLQNEMHRFHVHDTMFLIFLIYVSAINPFIEELFWRILLYPKKYNFLIDIAYAGYHILILRYFIQWYFIIVAIVALIIAGRIWRYIYKKNHTTLLIIVTHGIADCSILLAVYLRIIMQ